MGSPASLKPNKPCKCIKSVFKVALTLANQASCLNKAPLPDYGNGFDPPFEVTDLAMNNVLIGLHSTPSLPPSSLAQGSMNALIVASVVVRRGGARRKPNPF